MPIHLPQMLRGCWKLATHLARSKQDRRTRLTLRSFDLTIPVLASIPRSASSLLTYCSSTDSLAISSRSGGPVLRLARNVSCNCLWLLEGGLIYKGFFLSNGQKKPPHHVGEDRDGVYGKENRVVTGYCLLPVLLLDNVSGEPCCSFATSRSWLIRCWCLSCKTACCSGVSR